MAEPPTVPGDYGIAAARRAGYSDTEIADYVAGQLGADITAARQAGYRDDEILKHLVPAPKAEPDPPKVEAPKKASIGDDLERGLKQARSDTAMLGASIAGARLGDIEAAKAKADRGEYLTPIEREQVRQYDEARANTERQLAENVTTGITERRAAEQLPISPEYKAFKEAGNKGFTEALKAFWKAPGEVVTSILAEGAAATAPSLAAAATTGVVGGTVVAGGQAYLQAYANKVVDLLAKKGVDIDNRDAVMKALSDPKVADSIRNDASLSAIPQAAAGAASMAVAPVTMAPARLATRPVAQQAVNIPAQAAVQGVLAAGGEAGSSVAIGEEIEGGKVAVAGISGAAQGPLDAAVFAARRAVGAARDTAAARVPEEAALPVMEAGTVDEAIAAAREVVSRPAIEETAVLAQEFGNRAEQDEAAILRLFGGLNDGVVERAPDGAWFYRSDDGKEWQLRPWDGVQRDDTIPAALAAAQRAHYEKLGVRVVYFENDKAIPFDGAVDPAQPNTIFLSNDMARNAAQVGAHEVGHLFESTVLPDGTHLGDLLHQQVAAGMTAEGRAYAERLFGPTAPKREKFPEGPTGDSLHADAVTNHLIRELGADLHGEAPKFQTFMPKVLDAVEARYGVDAAKDVLQKLMAGIRQAMTTLRQFFFRADEMAEYGQLSTESQRWVSNLEEIHGTLAQMYAERFGSQAEKENARLQQMRDATLRERTLKRMETPAQEVPPPTMPEGFLAPLPEGRPGPAPGPAYADALQRVRQYQRWLGELDQKRRTDAEVSPQATLLRQTEQAILGKVRGVEARLTKVAAERLANVRAQLEDLLNPTGDSPDMARVREALRAEQQRMANAASVGTPSPGIVRAAPPAPVVAEVPQPEVRGRAVMPEPVSTPAPIQPEVAEAVVTPPAPAPEPAAPVVAAEPPPAVDPNSFAERLKAEKEAVWADRSIMGRVQRNVARNEQFATDVARERIMREDAAPLIRRALEEDGLPEHAIPEIARLYRQEDGEAVEVAFDRAVDRWITKREAEGALIEEDLYHFDWLKAESGSDPVLAEALQRIEEAYSGREREKPGDADIPLGSDDPRAAAPRPGEAAARDEQAGSREDRGGPRSGGEPAGKEGAALSPRGKDSPAFSPRPPVARIAADALAAPDADIKALRQAAIDWYRVRLQGRTVTNPELGEIVFTGRGRREMRYASANPDKLRVTTALPEILRDGRLDGTTRDAKGRQDVVAYHRLVAPVEIGDRAAFVSVVVEERANGKLYYNHYVGSDEASLRAASAPGDKTGASRPGEAPGAAGEGDGLNIGLSGLKDKGPAFSPRRVDTEPPGPVLLETLEASADELGARQRQVDKERAQLAMRGRKKAPKPQQAVDDTPLFGGERQQTLFSPKPFYSALTRAVEALRMDKAPPGQWEATIRNLPGVKPEERTWVGIDDWLRQQAKPVSKAEVLDYLRANEISVDEVMKGSVDWEAQRNRAFEAGDMDEYNRLVAAENASSPPKFGNYTLPGGQNYRELLLRLPAKENIRDIPAGWRVEKVSDASYRVMEEGGSAPLGYGSTRGEALQQALAENGIDHPDAREWYHSSHWDETNVLAHVRFDDRSGANGEKILHVAEIQSDWHQAGRKRGYREPKENELARLLAEREELATDRRYAATAEREAELDAKIETTQARIDELGGGDPGVPDAPFKTTWPELAFKRVLRYAAENGYDRITWDTGRTNADRYDLSKQVDSINYAKDGDGTWTVDVRKRDGNRWQSLDRREKQTLAQLEDYVGKDAADRIRRNVGHEIGAPAGSGDLRGLDLKVGGEGMAAFYDKQLPLIASKIGKKFGAKVESASLDQPPTSALFPEKTSLRGESVAVHSLALTPAMRDGVMQGQPLFSPRADLARQIADARAETNTDPTEGQKEAGNYAKGRVTFHGLPFVMENPEGSIRRGVDADGKPWEATLPADYGYLSRTEGADGDHVDAYIGPDLDSQRAWVIDQIDPETGKFDEHKIVMGVADWNAARDIYERAFSDGSGPDRMGNASQMNLNELKTWLAEGDTTKPVVFSPRVTAAGRDVRVVGDNPDREYTPAQLKARENVRGTERRSLAATLSEWREDLGKKLVREIFDPYVGVKDRDAAGYLALRMANSSTGAVDMFNTWGTLKLDGPVYRTDKQTGGPVALIRDLGKEAHDFMDWVAANRAERLKAEDRENLFTAEDIAALKSLNKGKLDFDYPLGNGETTRSREAAYLDALKRLDTANKNAQDIAVEGGLLNRKTVDELWANPFYVPFYRQAEEGNSRGFVGGGGGGGFTGKTAFKKLKGGTEKLTADLWQNAFGNWAHLIDASIRNRAANQVLETAAKDGIVENITAQQYDHVLTKAEKEDVVWTMVDGEKTYWRVDDPFTLKAITALDYVQSSTPLMGFARFGKRLLQTGVAASPIFQIRNLIRDTENAIAVSPIAKNVVKNLYDGGKQQDIANGLKNVARAVAGQELKQARLSRETADAVAGGATMRYAAGVDQSFRNADTYLDSESKIGKFWDYFRRMGQAGTEAMGFGENMNRLALYRQLGEQGAPRELRAYEARDLSDFTLTGASPIIRHLVETVPYMNAWLQGLYKVGRAAADSDRNVTLAVGGKVATQITKRLAAVTMGMVALNLALDAIYADDEDYQNRNEYDRNSNFWFKIGKTEFRIPMGFEVAALSRLASVWIETLYDKDMPASRAWKNTMSIVGTQMGMNPIPQIVKPLYDLAANETRMGTPIETTGMERLRPEFRSAAETTLVAKGISEATNKAVRAVGGANARAFSPVQLDYLVQAYTGWLGTSALQIADTVVRSMSNEPEKPAKDALTKYTGGLISNEPTSERGNGRYVNMLYQQGDAIKEAYSTYRDLLKRGRTEEARDYLDDNRETILKNRLFERVIRIEGDLNEQIRTITESTTLSPEQKKVRIMQLRAMKNRAAQSVFATEARP